MGLNAQVNSPLMRKLGKLEGTLQFLHTPVPSPRPENLPLPPSHSVVSHKEEPGEEEKCVLEQQGKEKMPSHKEESGEEQKTVLEEEQEEQKRKRSRADYVLYNKRRI
jgi:hypothetical protein